MTNARESCIYEVNYATPRSFGTALKSDLKETLFPDDPFHEFRNEPPSKKAKKAVQYFVPIFEWLPKYSLRFFKYDLLAGITIASLAIPQGISYAKLANLPPIIGLYSSFVPPLVYAVFGSSKHLAVGTVAACSLLIGSIIGQKVSPVDEPELYLHLVFTATFFTGILQAAMGFLRLGIVVDFLSHSTITGFMGGTATIICLQQLKGMFGLKHFTTKTDVVSVLHSIITHRNEVGDLKKGINPLSIQHLNFDPKYIAAPIQAAIITAMVALAGCVRLVSTSTEMGSSSPEELGGGGNLRSKAAEWRRGTVLQSPRSWLLGFKIQAQIQERLVETISRVVEKSPKHAGGGCTRRSTLTGRHRVTCIDITGIETLIEILKALEAKGIKMALVSPRVEVMQKLIVTKFIDTIGKKMCSYRSTM
ncbi:hypothetical protein C3L33_05293, partial [Rhododendron williamsianum]